MSKKILTCDLRACDNFGEPVEVDELPEACICTCCRGLLVEYESVFDSWDNTYGSEYTPTPEAVLSAYTGILMGTFSELHEYVEHLFARSVWTHEFPTLAKEIKNRSKTDYEKMVNALK